MAVEIAEAPPRQRILSPRQILDVTEARAKKFAARNESYNQAIDYYFGRQKAQGTQAQIKAMDSKGRPLLRWLGSSWENQQRRVVSNRIKPIVDDYQALLGRVPKARVDPPDDSEDAEAKAEKLTKYLVSTYELSRLPIQQNEAGWYLSLLGDACYLLEVDPELWRVAIAIVNPMFAFPAFKRGYLRHELHDLIIASVEDPEDIEQNYGVKPDGDKTNDRTVMTYLSPWQRTVILGEKPIVLAHVEHNLGWCPARWHFNQLAAGEFAMSDVSQIFSWQDYFNFALNVSADGLVEMTYPLRHLINPAAFGEDQLEIGPGSTVVSDEGGKIELVNPTPPPQAALQLMQLGMSEMTMGAGTTPVRMEGTMDSSIVTGRAMQTAQGPQASRIDLKQAALTFTFARLNAMALEMQEKAPFLSDKEFEINGRLKGKEFRETMKSAEIDGMYQNTVSWDTMVGVSLQQKLATAANGRATMLFDDIYARDMIGMEDPLGMRQRIEEEKKWEGKLQAEIQGMMQGQQATVGPPGAPPTGGASAVAASQQPAGPQAPPMIFRPPSMAPPTQLPRGVPQGVTLTAIQNAMQGLSASLKGEVWASGELASQGVAMKPELYLTNFKDYRVVKQALLGLTKGFSLKSVSTSEAVPDPKARVA